jgi:hypothetical protein
MRKNKNATLNKRRIMLVLIIAVVFILAIVAFGRYIYNSMTNSYATSAVFYFASDFLTPQNVEHQYSNWNGKDLYKIYINLYSYNYPNKLEDSDYNIDYNLTVEDNQYVDFSIKNKSGTVLSMPDIIYRTEKSKTIVIEVTPKEDVDVSSLSSVSIKVKAKATRAKETSTDTSIPTFEREIAGTFVLNISPGGSYTYSINDAEDEDSFELLLTNSSGTANTFNLSVNPEEVIFDMASNELVKYMIKSSITTQSVNVSNNVTDSDDNDSTDDDNDSDSTDDNSIDYVKSLKVKLPAESTIKINFYKKDSSADYTYSLNSNIGETSIVTVSAN